MSRRTGPGVPAPLDAVLAAERRMNDARRDYIAYIGDGHRESRKSGKESPVDVRDRYHAAVVEFLRLAIPEECP